LDDAESGSVRCWRAGDEVVEPDAASDRHFREFVEMASDVQMRSALDAIRSFACFPILFEGTMMGVLCLHADRQGHFGPRVKDTVRDYAGVIGPIARIERYPEELRAAEKRLLDAAATAAHRLNNPSFTIQKRVEVWQHRQREGTADLAFTEDTLRVIGEQAARVGNLVKDLRAFLMRPAPCVPSHPIDLNHSIQRIVSGALGSRPEFCVEWDLAASLPQAHLDEKLIADILEELVANACKAMRDGGVITIRTRVATENDKIQHGLWTVRPYLRVEVQDSGPGIPAEKKGRVFEPFHSGFSQGTGLGLSIVRNSVDSLQGAIWEEGGPKLGAHFVMILPVTPEQGRSRK
jgi:signal transduction histidine kinase